MSFIFMFKISYELLKFFENLFGYNLVNFLYVFIEFFIFIQFSLKQIFVINNYSIYLCKIYNLKYLGFVK